MNENTAPVEGAEATTEESAETGGTTAEEVSQVLGLPTQEPEAAAEEEAEAETAEETATEEAAPEVETTAEETEQVEEQAQVEAPDFNLEVEDANGDTIVIEPGANLEEVLATFKPKNNGQIFQIIKDVMQKESEQKAWEEQEQTKAQEAEYQQRLTETRQRLDNEVIKLQGEKRLPLDGKIEERKEQVFAFMVKENEARAKDGRPFIQSFEDALDKLELRESREAAAQAAKEAKETARKNGGLVGGSSAPASSGAPAYKGGARTANEALQSMNLL